MPFGLQRRDTQVSVVFDVFCAFNVVVRQAIINGGFKAFQISVISAGFVAKTSSCPHS